jgi:hypothetical protein
MRFGQLYMGYRSGLETKDIFGARQSIRCNLGIVNRN